MNIAMLRAAAVVIAGALPAAAALGGQPAPNPQRMPGATRATVESRWIAPGVSVTDRAVAGGPPASVVTWLAPDGKVRREVAATGSTGPGFVTGGGRTLYAVNGDWQLVLPDKGDRSGYVTASPDSRVLVHQFHPRPGQTAVDVYVAGALAGTLGPFTQYPLDDVTLGDDGAVAVLAWKDDQKRVPRVVVAGPDGKERFRADCDGPVAGAWPAPDGAAAVVRSNGEADRRRQFSYYDGSGKVSSLDVGPNARLAAWAGAAPTAVMETSDANGTAWHVVDWRAGKRLRTVRDPNPARATWAGHPVAATKDYLLVGGLEYLSYEDQKMPVRSIYAVGVADGRVAAHWLPDPKHQPAADAGRFLQLGQRLYYLTDAAYCEIDPADIAGHKSGWR